MISNYEPSAEQIVALYQQLEDDIIQSMIKRLMHMGLASESAVYQAEILQESGLLYDDIMQMIANSTDASVAQVKALFEDAGVETVAIDNEIAAESGEPPIDIKQSDNVRQVLDAGYKKTLGTMQNLVSTTAETTQTAFVSACDRAYMQVSSGAFSYQEAIRQAVKNIADTGAYITYQTGHKDRIDVAMRRCVLTGVGQTSAAVAKEHAEQSGCKLMELTAHGGARPEHARWQGQLVSMDGKDAGETIDGMRVFTLKEIGYGSGDGFKGWNCRHNWHPYYKGISTPNYTKKDIEKLEEKSVEYNGEKYTDYEASQMQRAAERKVRELKRRTMAAQDAAEYAPDGETKVAMQGDYEKRAADLKVAENELLDFCRQTHRKRDTFRQQVNGFGKSTSQKAVQAAKSGASNRTAQSTASAGKAVEIDVQGGTNGGNGALYKGEKIKK